MLTILIAILSLIPTFTTDDDNAHKGSIVNRIIIDPGHGGEDKGAIGPTGLLEKDVNLAIALKLRAIILADPLMKKSGVEVFMTREDDRLVSLEERSNVANDAKGDLFISIHVNSFTYRSVYGPETYFLSLTASDAHARKVAEVENQVFGGANGGVEDDDLKQILFDVMHKSHIEQAMLLAKEIQTEFNRNLKLRDRGVRQAPFRVLKSVSMPAVLVEVDYLSNPARERELRTDAYQNLIARSLLTAIKHYKLLKESGSTADSTSTGDQSKPS